MNYSSEAEKLMRAMFNFGKLKSQKEFLGVFGGGRFILQLLHFKKDTAMTPGDISELMGISTARVAVALNMLEEKSYVKREIDIIDRRRIIVQLTEQGEKRAATLIETIQGKMANLLIRLGENDTKELIRIIEKVTDILVVIDDEVEA